jgi:poly-gamma-glutamate capsule biosynthesis protein CapA/YwtB (metallophosphatase superfamily)
MPFMNRLTLLLSLVIFPVLFAHTTLAQTRIRVAVVGDFMCHDSQITAAKQSNGNNVEQYDFTSCYAHITPLISKADFAFGNLETVLTGKAARYTGYPAFNSPDSYASAIKQAGFDALTTANNHSFDRRYEGVKRTLQVLYSLGIPHTGTTADLERRSKPLVVNVKGIKIGIIAYTYGLNDGAAPENYRMTVNIMDTAAIRSDVQYLQSLAPAERPDVILASLHWGSEYQLQPRKEQRRFANWLFRLGVHALLGAHPHVVQTVEKQEFVHMGAGKIDTTITPAVYSMGNFISGQRTKPREAGVVVWLDIEKQLSGQARIVGLGFTPTYIYKSRTATGRTAYIVLNVPQAVREIEQNPKAFPASIHQRLRDIVRDITKQFSTPDNAFELIE